MNEVLRLTLGALFLAFFIVAPLIVVALTIKGDPGLHPGWQMWACIAIGCDMSIYAKLRKQGLI